MKQKGAVIYYLYRNKSFLTRHLRLLRTHNVLFAKRNKKQRLNEMRKKRSFFRNFYDFITVNLCLRVLFIFHLQEFIFLQPFLS